MKGRRTGRTALLLAALALWLGASQSACDENQWADGDADADADTDVDADGDGEPSGCVDLDGDGYGPGCALGPDCDDTDPASQATCTAVELGGESRPFDPRADNSNGVTLDRDGRLTLDSYPEIEPAVWIANAREGTVSRLDAHTGREIARYRSALTRPRTENDPSRTGVDFRGDCWVANRARSGHQQGSVTKIASHIEDCIDRNGDGEIQTSSDLNGDGRIELGSDEYLDTEDECILFTTDLGARNGIPRALAIAPDAAGTASGGNAWVGLNGERRAAEIDGSTGEIRRWVDLPLNPYGAIASKYEGKVWFVNAGWQSELPDNPPAIVAVDFRTAEVSPRVNVRSTNSCVGTYGITVDARSRVWVGGYPCSGAFRYDPAAGEWLTVVVPDGGRPRGIVADAEGWVWLAHSGNCGRDHCGLVSRFRAEDGGEVSHYWLPTGNDTIGVDLDAEGRVWVVSQATDNAARIDPVSGAIEEFPTGSGPYTYSDFTGHSLLLQFPRGYYRDVVEACAGAEWRHVRWDARTPGDTSVEVRVRSAATRVDLAAAPWIGPYRTSPADLSLPPGPVAPGAFLELELTLISMDPVAVPSVGALVVAFECPVG